ncbi:zeta toxin family protein [Nocardiopsis dassonvillei]|uniref:zeta toxin family protein n=1 Tax=Nocardiopsis dassonvillei TaxID=2014 RepID=UPI0033E40711
MDPGLSFEDQEHLRSGAGTFDSPYIFRASEEYWMVVASDSRTGRHATARFNTDEGDGTAHGHRERVQEFKDMMGTAGYTGRERAAALAEDWKRIHRETHGPARPARRRSPRRQWPYQPKENAPGAQVAFEVDGEQLTGQIWGTSPRARSRYVVTDDQRLFHVHIDTLTGHRVNPHTDLNTAYGEKAAAVTAPVPQEPAAVAEEPPAAPEPDPLAAEIRPGSNYEAAMRIQDLLRQGEFDLARAYARREATDPILGPDLDQVQRLHRRLDPVESLQGLVEREAGEVYTLARRGGARTEEQIRARRRQAHEQHVRWLLDVLPPGSVHHARARRLEAELRAEDHTHINDQIRALAQTAEAERGPIRAELLDGLYALSRMAPVEDVAALLARANLNDPSEAGVRESLRAQLTLPAADDPAFADVMVIDHDTLTWHLSPTTPDSVRDVLAEHGFSGTYSRTDPWVVLTEDLGMEALRERMGSLYTALDQLPEAPPRASATLWRARISATLDEHESVRRARMDQAQERARERIGQLMGQGEMRAAFAVVHEHIAELRAHAFLPGVIERNPEFEDLYLEVFTEADRRRELLDAELAALPSDEATLERMAAEYRRQCPHLGEQTILEAVGLASPGISLTGTLGADLAVGQEAATPETAAAQQRSESAEPPRTLTREELTELRPYLRRAMTGSSIVHNEHGHRVSLERVSKRTKTELRDRGWMRTGPDEHLYLTAEGERVREALGEMDLPSPASAPPPAPEMPTVPSRQGDANVADEPTLFPDLDASAPEAEENAAPAPAAAEETPAQQGTAPAPEPEAPQAETVDEPAPAQEPPALEDPEPAAEEAPSAEEEALAGQERLAEWESIADTEDAGEAPAATAHEPPRAEPTSPPNPEPDPAAQQPSEPAAAEPDMDIERERLAANLGTGPGRHATIGLTDDDTGPEPDRPAQAANRRATIFIPGDADTGPAPDPVRVQEAGREEPPAMERIDGRQLRAAHPQWGDLYRRRGWKAATDRVDPDVYAKMRRDFEKVLKRGSDVQLVMPTNDPVKVLEFAAMAREYGYEITLAARITPDAQRKLGQLEALDQHLHAQTIHQAVHPDQHRQEARNLEKILAQAQEQKLVNRIALYPREGSQPVWGTHLIHDSAAQNPERERVWSSSESVLNGMRRLQGVELSDGEKLRLREGVERLTRRLPGADQVVGDYAHARAHLADGLNELRSELKMPPADEDRARRVTVQTNEQQEQHQEAPAARNGESASARSRVRGSRPGVSGAAINGPVPEGSSHHEGHTQAPPPHAEKQSRTMARTS